MMAGGCEGKDQLIFIGLKLLGESGETDGLIENFDICAGHN